MEFYSVKRPWVPPVYPYYSYKGYASGDDNLIPGVWYLGYESSVNTFLKPGQSCKLKEAKNSDQLDAACTNLKDLCDLSTIESEPRVLAVVSEEE